MTLNSDKGCYVFWDMLKVEQLNYKENISIFSLFSLSTDFVNKEVFRQRLSQVNCNCKQLKES